mmetsp:Transcript_52060/g.110625  ORF Transcript_52060/g.110625 Transcript_52060/m.110625 type:complete len:249 (+) Transcript_52060:2891-3637(+)
MLRSIFSIMRFSLPTGQAFPLAVSSTALNGCSSPSKAAQRTRGFLSCIIHPKYLRYLSVRKRSGRWREKRERDSMHMVRMCSLESRYLCTSNPWTTGPSTTSSRSSTVLFRLSILTLSASALAPSFPGLLLLAAAAYCLLATSIFLTSIADWSSTAWETLSAARVAAARTSGWPTGESSTILSMMLLTSSASSLTMGVESPIPSFAAEALASSDAAWDWDWDSNSLFCVVAMPPSVSATWPRTYQNSL